MVDIQATLTVVLSVGQLADLLDAWLDSTKAVQTSEMMLEKTAEQRVE
jgi:hypothetical protein